MNIKEETRKMKLASPILAAASLEKRNHALALIRESLLASKEEIFAANRKDLALAEESGIAPAVKKRLKFDEGKLADVEAELTGLIALPDPIDRVTLARELDEGLSLYRVTCPIGVIFEARPDALVQISSLCLKSGNCAILKGGKETTYTNRILFRLIQKAAIAAGLPENALLQAEQHNEIDELLECHESVDLLIPRGSNAFVQYIMSHTAIPVLGHADGVCHIYVDKDYEEEIAIPAIVDAKVQYPAACNAVETILVHRSIAKDLLPKLARALTDAGVTIRGTKEVNDIIPVDVIPESESFHKEYLSLTLAIKIVGDLDEAISGVYQNASTRFADGFRYGFGAEVGISTSKIHARGPVGLEGLISYKYKLFGHGQIVGDYASGKKQFHFKDLK